MNVVNSIPIIAVNVAVFNDVLVKVGLKIVVVNNDVVKIVVAHVAVPKTVVLTLLTVLLLMLL